MDKRLLALAAEEVRQLEEARARRLETLKADADFQLETTRVQKALTELRSTNPEAFNSFFAGFTYLSVFRQRYLSRLLRQIKDQKSVEILRQYVRYAARFQVTLRWRKNHFRITAYAPFKSKYRARINNGRLEAAFKELRQEPRPVWEDFYADDQLKTAKVISDFLAKGTSKFVELEDHLGQSLLNEVESFAYSTDALTFIVHRAAHHPYLFCLVGEKVSTETWRKAGKVVTALQKELYHRTKSGRPTNLSRMRKAIQLREEAGSQPLKERAFELMTSDDTKLETQQHYLSTVGRKLKRRSN